MSNSLAIAAVTATLRNVLTQGVTMVPALADTTVTTQLPDRARAGTTTANQINLFLYASVPNAAWRNMDMPRTSKPGESAQPPLALNLYYLLTTYGRDDDLVQPFSHELLGRAMSILHDHPVLGSQEIRGALAGNDLGEQAERIRFSIQPLSVEEIYRLWTGFATPYRTSVAYEASVVLIDSLREARAPLPVLTRGTNDRGATLHAATSPPFATITALTAPNETTFGDTVRIVGAQLAGDAVTVNVARPGTDAVALKIEPDSNSAVVRVKIPADGNLSAGIYSLAVAVKTGADTRTSNVFYLALAPQITSKLPLTLDRAADDSLVVELSCHPPIAAGQRVALLLGDREISAPPILASTPNLRFTVPAIAAGTYFVRLRVDGADSPLLVDRAPTAQRAFDLDRRITVR